MEINMNSMQDLFVFQRDQAIIEAAIYLLEECEGEYAINDIADLAGLPTRIVREHIHYDVCRPEWIKLRQRLSPMGYLQLND